MRKSLEYRLIADSGSTKTDWVLLDSDSGRKNIGSLGINPFVIGEGRILEILRTELLPKIPYPTQIKEIFYYGAGVSNEPNRLKVHNSLSQIMPNAEIHVLHDLLAAARSLCGNDPGAVGILGTGSNACIYNGRKIIDEVICLGHLAGDEGSGNHLGKLLMQHYFYRKLPEELNIAFQAYYPKSKKEIVKELFDTERPNTFLASFTKFLNQKREHPTIQKIIRHSFQSFVDNFLFQFEGIKELPVHLTGSISFHFSKELNEVLSENGLQMGKIIQKPMKGLIEYHKF